MAEGTEFTNTKAEQIARHIAQATQSGAKALKVGDVPSNIEALTPEWLTDVVCADHPGAAVTDFSIEHISSGTHARHRLHLTYNDAGIRAGLPATLFTKSLPTVEIRMISGTTMHVRTEGNFYTQLRPQLDLEIPHCYHTVFDTETYAGLHLLEDLVATKGASFCNFKTPITRAEAEDMLGLLAGVHGRFYDDPRFAGEYKWVVPYTKWFLGGNAKLNVELSTKNTLDRAADIIPPRLLTRRKDVWPAAIAALKAHEERPHTFLHSDVHIGNWYKTNAQRMGLCDWQCAGRGHWARDVSYALSTAFRIEDRRAWERDLLAGYLERLEEVSGQKFAFDDSWTLYRQQVLHGLMNWTPTLCPTGHLPAMQTDETSLAMIERMCAAIDDLESLDAATA